MAVVVVAEVEEEEEEEEEHAAAKSRSEAVGSRSIVARPGVLSLIEEVLAYCARNKPDA